MSLNLDSVMTQIYAIDDTIRSIKDIANSLSKGEVKVASEILEFTSTFITQLETKYTTLVSQLSTQVSNMPEVTE